VSIDENGVLTLHGDARVIKGMWIGAEGMSAPPAQSASWVDHGISGAWRFIENANPATAQTVVSNMMRPYDIDHSVNPAFTIGWSAGVVVGNCEWQVEYLWTAEDENTIAGAQDTLLGSVDADNVTVSGVANGLVRSNFSIDPPGVNDRCLHVRIRRRGDLAADTVTGVVELIGVCMSYTSNKLGEPI